MKIVTVVGARPQFIKAAVVSREISKHNGMQEIIVHTGQHFDANMSDVFFEDLQIPRPQYRLEINSMSHGAMTGMMLGAIENVLLREKPAFVMVYGDTNSTLAGALAAKKLHIKVAHVEAGLRSFNMKMPEEINRILTDRISDILFCPTDTAVSNLHKEGFDHFPCHITKTGDVMYDAALFYRQLTRKPNVDHLPDRGFVLATIHRAENTDDEYRLTNILEALQEISLETPIVLPLHPRTRKILGSTKLILKAQNMHLIDPVGYLEMVWLLERCSMVMTDSGGLQKEAYIFQKPCITLRDETEWVELVEAKANRLAGAASQAILGAWQAMKDQNIQTGQLYGSGNAAKQIVAELIVCQ